MAITDKASINISHSFNHVTGNNYKKLIYRRDNARCRYYAIQCRSFRVTDFGNWYQSKARASLHVSE